MGFGGTPLGRRRALCSALVVFAVLLAAALPALTPLAAHAAPSIQTRFDLPEGQTTYPTGIATGPDGNLWVSEFGSPHVDRLTPSGTFSSTLISLAANVCGAFSWGITAGPDGNVWFTQMCLLTSTRGSWGHVGKLTPAGVLTQYDLPSTTPYTGSDDRGPNPIGITSGPDGNLWLTEFGTDAIARVTTSGNATEFPLPTASAGPYRIAPGPDGNLWFTESSSDKIGRITPSGTITEFPIATGSQPKGVVAGPDGNIWFTESGSGKIGRMSTSGTAYAEYTIPTANTQPESITVAGGSLWFTEYNANAVAKLTTAGAMTEYATQLQQPFDLTAGPDGDIWYTAWGSNAVGRLPQVACGDLVTSMSTSRVAPGGAETFNATLENCGTPPLTSATTTTTVAPPAGCGAAPPIPSFTATLSYAQSTASNYSFSAPSCAGGYVVTSKTSMNGSVVATTSTNYVVSNGAGSHIAGDFNGDGYEDVAVGNATDSTYGFDWGSIKVYYGSASGLSSLGTQYFYPLSPGMPSQMNPGPSGGSGLGGSLAPGDFNADGYSDLAVGAAGLGYPNAVTGGAVILRGSPTGLTTTGSQFIAPATSVTASTVLGEPGAAWAASLAAGDLNGDGYADLVSGAATDSQASDLGGSLTVMYGSASGVAPSQQVIVKTTPGMPGPRPGQDELGATLAIADFNHDGYSDIAATALNDSAVYMLRGSASGVTTSGSQFLAAIGPNGGSSLAAGDFNGDGYFDLAVGDPWVNQSNQNDVVEIHYGTSAGLGSVGYKTAQRFSPTTTGMPVAPGTVYSFGTALAAGDFNHDGHTDLAIGASWIGNNGGFYVLKGTATKLIKKGAKIILTANPQGYGPSMGSGDFNSDGFTDLLWSRSGVPTSIYAGSTKSLPLTTNTSVPDGGAYSAQCC